MEESRGDIFRPNSETGARIRWAYRSFFTVQCRPIGLPNSDTYHLWKPATSWTTENAGMDNTRWSTSDTGKRGTKNVGIWMWFMCVSAFYLSLRVFASSYAAETLVLKSILQSVCPLNFNWTALLNWALRTLALHLQLLMLCSFWSANRLRRGQFLCSVYSITVRSKCMHYYLIFSMKSTFWIKIRLRNGVATPLPRCPYDHEY